MAETGGDAEALALRASQIQQIHERWQRECQLLFARDGTHPTHANGGNDIAGNPALRATLTEIAESYFPLLQEKWEAKVRFSEAQFEVLSTEAVGDEYRKVEDQWREADARYKAADEALAVHNSRSLQRMLEPGSGLEQEVARHQPEENEREAKAKGVAGQILGALIHSCVNASLMVHREDLRSISRREGPMTMEQFVPKRFGELPDDPGEKNTVRR